MDFYTRLTIKDREEISRMLASSQSLRSIAKELKRSPSSISRELHRNKVSVWSYRAIEAERHAS